MRRTLPRYKLLRKDADFRAAPVGLEEGGWVDLLRETAKHFVDHKNRADRAYGSAFERESTTAQILWDRAENLRQAGRVAQARKLYQQLADGDWQPRFASLKEQAKWMLEGR